MVILGVVLYLAVRNEPFRDPNLVVMVRTVLSMAVAILGATVPGFFHLGWSGKDLAIRAGGALALFVLTFLLTPGTVDQRMSSGTIEQRTFGGPAINNITGDVVITNGSFPQKDRE